MEIISAIMGIGIGYILYKKVVSPFLDKLEKKGDAIDVKFKE